MSRYSGNKRGAVSAFDTQMVSPPDTPLTVDTTNTNPPNNPPTILPFSTIQGPRAAETNSRLENVAFRISQGERPDNTALAYDPKEEEWRQFCAHVYKNDSTAIILNGDRVYRFLFYQCFRELKKRGGKKGGGRWSVVFDTTDYDQLIKSCSVPPQRTCSSSYCAVQSGTAQYLQTTNSKKEAVLRVGTHMDQSL